MSERQIALTTVKGLFPLPLGVKFYNFEVGNWPRTVLISTVCLDGAHLEDPVGICDPEMGYETMVFLAGYGSLSLYTQKYNTEKEAEAGHRCVVQKLIDEKLPLAIPIIPYHSHDKLEGDQTEHADSHELASMKWPRQIG